MVPSDVIISTMIGGLMAAIGIIIIARADLTIASNAKEMIEACEIELPRNQSCEIQAIPITVQGESK